VGNSDPVDEAAETRVKAAGLLSALSAASTRPATAAGAPLAGLAAQPVVLDALARRNVGLADFWFRPLPAPVEHEDRRVLVIDAEDSFTAMLEHQIRACGPEVTVQPVSARLELAGYDLVVLGPGPGDPGQLADPKIRRLNQHLQELLAARVPILAICLGHQIVSASLGLALARRPVPDQGVQRQFRLFERDVRVGFYSTFTACSAVDELWSPGFGQLRVSRDPDSGEVYGLHGRQLRSYQFHPESILSMDGMFNLQDALTALLPEPAVSR
jgi:phenazine biosynthesis protein phzE